MMFRKYVLLLPIIAVSACAYTFDKHYQEVEIRTPGAQDALCEVMANKIKYKFYPPEKRLLPKSKEDLIVQCMAPGNRDRTVVIRPQINNKFYGNAASAMTGGVWDFASGAMFDYPDVIDVDFTGMPLREMELPAHNNPDIKQPDEYYLEEFRPGTPRMNADRFKKSVPIQSRVAPGGDGDLYDEGFGFSSTNSENVIEEYEDQYTGDDDSGSYVEDILGSDIDSSALPSGEGVVVIDTKPDITLPAETSTEETSGPSDSSESVDSFDDGESGIDGLPFPESNSGTNP